MEPLALAQENPSTVVYLLPFTFLLGKVAFFCQRVVSSFNCRKTIPI